MRDKYDDMQTLEHQAQFMMLLNSVNYLRTVISEWSDQVVCLSNILPPSVRVRAHENVFLRTGVPENRPFCFRNFCCV